MDTTEDGETRIDDVEQFSQDKVFDAKSDYYMECKYSTCIFVKSYLDYII